MLFTLGPAEAMLRRWFMEDKGAIAVWEDNQTVVDWLTSGSVIEENLKSIFRDAAVDQVKKLLEVCDNIIKLKL